MKLNAMTATSLLVMTLAYPIGNAIAQTDMVSAGDTEMQALAATSVTAADAVNAAEKASGGKVVELTLDMVMGKAAYRVTVVASDGLETNYLVDAATGSAVLYIEEAAQGSEPEDDVSEDNASGVDNNDKGEGELAHSN
ncbi:MAG: hypothetical protein JWR75_1051 [Devosia sp.]|nr:hypothetical protein [Devosia sp.]